MAHIEDKNTYIKYIKYKYTYCTYLHIHGQSKAVASEGVSEVTVFLNKTIRSSGSTVMKGGKLIEVLRFNQDVKSCVIGIAI